LGGNNSSRLYQQLVKEQKLFVHLDCYHFGSSDPGLLTIEGKLAEGISMGKAEQALQLEIDKICKEGPSEQELQKVKNKTESLIAFEDMSVMSRASSLAYYELLGDAAWMNTELQQYANVTTAQIKNVSNQVFRAENSNTLYYYATK
jgi:predicted Zn-dependent peptidase